MRLESHSVPWTARARTTHSPPSSKSNFARRRLSGATRALLAERRRSAPECPTKHGAELHAQRSLRVHLVGCIRQRGLAVVERAPACTRGMIMSALRPRLSVAARRSRFTIVVFAPQHLNPPSSLSTALTAWGPPSPRESCARRGGVISERRRESIATSPPGAAAGLAASRGRVVLKKARAEAGRETHLYSMMWGSGLWMA